MKDILKKILFRKPKTIELGSIWWDDTGHISECDTGRIYVVLGRGKDDYWTCVALHFWGEDPRWLGACNSRHETSEIQYYLGDEEVLSMRYVGIIPSWKLQLTATGREREEGIWQLTYQT